ncbi:MAG TPA: hypothetical protein VK203_07240 [Nostocaceae cyanobacterium]|nr:hypothetical protein [Nostocaceae cyanobacterium]
MTNDNSTGNQALQQWRSLFALAFRSGEVCGYWGNGELWAGLIPIQNSKFKMGNAAFDKGLTIYICYSLLVNRYEFTVVKYPTNGLTIQSLYQAAS